MNSVRRESEGEASARETRTALVGRRDWYVGRLDAGHGHSMVGLDMGTVAVALSGEHMQVGG